MWSKNRGKVSWLSSALIILVMNFYSLGVPKACFPFFPSYLFNLCGTQVMSILLRQSWKLCLALTLASLPQTLRRACGMSAAVQLKGILSNPLYQCQNIVKSPRVEQKPSYFRKQRAFPSTSPCASASRVADGMAPVLSKASKLLLPATQADATFVWQGSIKKATGYQVRVLQGCITRVVREEPAGTLRLSPITSVVKLIKVQMEWAREPVWSN